MKSSRFFDFTASLFIKSLIFYAAATTMANYKKIEQQPRMLLSTTYGLNSSYSKKIQVGLITEDNVEPDFLPAVKLTSHGSAGICFDMESWQKFQENMETMSTYLSGDKINLSSIIFNKIIINFTTAYGARAILIAYRENEQEDLSSETAEDASADGPRLKKRKTYNIGIVMQRTTFQGLENIVDCVNANLNRLNFISNNVNECAQYLINEIQLKLPVSGAINNSIVKLTIRGNSKEIECNVRTQLKDLVFLDVYFEITFLEIISLYFEQIVHAIIAKRKF